LVGLRGKKMHKKCSEVVSCALTHSIDSVDGRTIRSADTTPIVVHSDFSLSSVSSAPLVLELSCCYKLGWVVHLA